MSWSGHARSAEEQRQHHVGNKLVRVAQDFRNLVDDLESNGILKSNQVLELKKAVDTLETVGNGHIKKAREHLHGPPKKLDEPEHLEAANQEIELALQKLNSLVQLAGSLEQTDRIRDDINVLIKEQAKLVEEAKKLAKEIATGKAKDPEPMLKALAEVEKGIAEKLKTLPEKLKDAAKGADADMKPKLKDALEVFKKNELDDKANSAADNLEKKDTALSASRTQMMSRTDSKMFSPLLKRMTHLLVLKQANPERFAG